MKVREIDLASERILRKEEFCDAGTYLLLHKWSADRGNWIEEVHLYHHGDVVEAHEVHAGNFDSCVEFIRERRIMEAEYIADI